MSSTPAPRRFLPPDLNPADLEQLRPLYQALLDRPLASPADLEGWLLDLNELDAAVDEAGTRAHNQHCCHTDDPAREKAYMHFVQVIHPALKPLAFALQRKFVASPHRAGLSEPKLQLLARRWQADVDLFREANIPLQTRVTELATEYGKICGKMQVEFRSQTYTLQQLAKFLEEPDRAVRQEAWTLSADRRLRDRDAIEAIFEQLLDLRGRIARNADLPDYRAYMWKSMKRFDYTPEQCRQFADAIAQVCVPLVAELDRQRQATMGLERLRPWDLAVDPLGRAPLQPFAQDQIPQFVAKTTQVFQRVDPQLGEQFASLRLGTDLDLDSRQGKRPGGYQSSLEQSRRPFIFMNAAGLHSDVDTLLHEGGHAFHYLAACDEPVLELRAAPLEFCEVASMAMELFGLPHLEVFYSREHADRARRQHLEGILRFFPWMAIIDSFQHWLYTHPGHSRAQRQEHWLSLLDRFHSPAVDWSGFQPHRAALWQRQLHLFNYPFYYIEYGIAQLGALQLWAQSLGDPAAALAQYRAGLALGGRRPLPDLFAAAGIRFDFSRQTLEPLIDTLRGELARLPQ